MGIVKRQGLLFTIISYLGAGVGAVNTLILYPRLMAVSSIGVIQLLFSVSVIYSQISMIGVPAIIIKYFPVFRTSDKYHHGFINWIAIIASSGFLTFSLIYFLARGTIIQFYNHSPLFIKFYYAVIPLALFLVLFNITEMLTRLLYRSLLSAFLNDIGLRLFTSVGIIFFYFKVISFDSFIIYYIAIYGFIACTVVLQLWMAKEFKWSPRVIIPSELRKELVFYGLFNFLAASTSILIQYLDVNMLAHFLSEAAVGAYATFFMIATMLQIPSVAMNRIIYPIVSEAWNNKDFALIKSNYKKSSLVLMIIGGYLVVELAFGKSILLSFLYKEEFKRAFPAFSWLCLAIVVNMTGGINTYIIAISNKYRISTLIMVFSVLVCFIGNYVLIPILGIVGAGVAFFSSYLVLNFFSWLYLKMRFDLQPFTVDHLWVLLSLAISSVIAFSVPNIDPFALNFFLKTGIFTICYFGIITYFRISEEVNQLANKLRSAILK